MTARLDFGRQAHDWMEMQRLVAGFGVEFVLIDLENRIDYFDQ